MEETMNSQRLPQTDSIQELASFWDTHDLTDFEDELEEVKEQVFEREQSITLRLPRSEAEVVHELAKARGMSDADLVREWVLEKIGRA
jgi:predicted DNA binding CopG/RHH family protein